MATITGASDAAIIQRIRQGDKEAYGEIVQRYNERLYRIGISILNDAQEVEDVMQNAYIKAYERLDTFKGRSEFSTWLIRILINEAIGRSRERKRFSSIRPQPSIPEEPIAKEVFIEARTPEDVTIQNDLRRILERSIHELPTPYQTVFMMREIEGMSIRETARSLNLTGETVKVRLHRAKHMLQKKLANSTGDVTLFRFHKTRCNLMVQRVLACIK